MNKLSLFILLSLMVLCLSIAACASSSHYPSTLEKQQAEAREKAGEQFNKAITDWNQRQYERMHTPAYHK
jgi:hypothetical protein